MKEVIGLISQVSHRYLAVDTWSGQSQPQARLLIIH